MEYIYERKINYYETDKMGIVHHSNYIRYFEEARCEFLKEIGLPYDELENNGLMCPVLGVSVDYKHHVTFGDTIVIHVKVVEFTGVKYKVSYTSYNKETGMLNVTGESKHCFTTDSLKPLNIKKSNKDVYEKFIKIVE